MNTDLNPFEEKIDANEIMELIPHRYPFLLIDQVKIIPKFKAIGIKNVSFNEPYFQGHFPNRPIMPGVLIIEAMAQTAAILVIKMTGKKENKIVYFMTIERARFRKPIIPGDQMHLHVEKKINKGNVWKFKGTAYVNGNVTAEATYSAMIVEN